MTSNQQTGGKIKIKRIQIRDDMRYRKEKEMPQRYLILQVVLVKPM